MGRELTRRRHGKHRTFDRTRKGGDTLGFLSDQQARLDAAEGDEGIFDSMHLVQGEDESFTFEDVQSAADPAAIGLTPSFTAQTQSIDFDGTEVLRNTTGQAIGIGATWSMLVWSKRLSGTGIQYICQANRFGSANHIEVLAQQALGGRGDFTWVDTSNSPTGVARWENFYSVGTWISTLFTWDGIELRVWKNGIQLGLPDSGDETPVPAPVMSDSLADRQLTLGGRESGANGWVGRVAQWAIWNTTVDAAAAFIQASPSSINLNVDSGAYIFSGNLAHWYRPGHEASPNLGKDFAVAGFTPTIDIEVNAVGITDADRVADVP